MQRKILIGLIILTVLTFGVHAAVAIEGNTLIVLRDRVIEVDPAGEVVWKWEKTGLSNPVDAERIIIVAPNTLSVQDARMPSGSDVQILILLNATDSIGNMDLTLTYDASVLGATGVIKGSLTANSLLDSNIGDGSIRIGFADSAGITGEGSIAQVSFEVRGWDPLTSPLRITGVIANDVETNEEVGIGVVDGTFTVGAMLGDCNGDGEINGADALLALSMAIGRAEENLVCDANEDGSVTSLDARLILQASVGIGESRLWGPPDSFATRELRIGEFTMEIPEGGLLIDRPVSSDEFTQLVASFLRENGYEGWPATQTAEQLLDSSLTQKLLGEENLAIVAADIRGTGFHISIGEEGKIKISELISFKPSRVIYCRYLPDGGRGSGIPCMKEKEGEGRTNLNEEEKQFVDGWREALNNHPGAEIIVDEKNAEALLALSDEELWVVIWGTSETGLSQEFTLRPMPIEAYLELEELTDPRQIRRAEIANQVAAEIEAQLIDDRGTEEDELEAALVRVDEQAVEQVREERIPLEGRSNNSVLLTGFTIDEEAGWSKKWRTRVCFDYWFDSWCTTYYIQPYYTYSYLFGLRVPLRLEAESFGLIAQDDRITGELSVSLTPFDGSAADYRAAGLPNNLVYGGRELLAVVCHKDCSAGLDADIPGPDVHIEGTVGEIDLLSKIGGKDNFKPPDVDQRERIADRTLDIDLLGGEADFGFVGAKVNPYLRIIMTGRDKSIKVDQTPDDGCSPQGEKLEHNERRNDFGPPPQGIPINLNNNNERVMIKHPAYTFNLQFTVGIEPRTWIDLYLWDHTWSLGRIPIYSPSSPNYRLNRHNGSNCGYPFRVADAAPAREQALQDAIEQRIAEITASVRCDRETRRLELIRQYEQKPLAAFRLCLQKADNLLNLPPEEICPDSSDRYRETQRLYRTVEWRKEWLCQNE